MHKLVAMIIQIALMVSVLLQFSAFFITISLIPKTRFNIAWITISFGLLLMAFRRLNDLLLVFESTSGDIQTILSSWIAVLISILMFIASFFIRKIFVMLEKLDQLRKENEARVLSAIIKTEEKERKSFARELHDGLGPILSSMKMALSALNKKNIQGMDQQIISKTETALKQAIDATREISNRLNPHVLERYGLEKATKSFTENLVTGNSIKIQLRFDLGKKRFPYNLEVITYRIICELINNALKHAGAANIMISIYDYLNKLELIYEDDGRGFDPEKASDKGMGLTNIQSRVKSLNGEMELSSRSGRGAYYKITLPYEK